MSGGSYNYMYSRVREEYAGYMYDEEMNDLIKDLCEVLHDLEWWQSSDYGEEEYRKTVQKFKDKWFKQSREERLKKYIDDKLNKMQKELYHLIGMKEVEDEK